MLFLRQILIPLFIVFVISILIRLPNLNRPLSKHHEFCTAIALRIMQIWDEEGIQSFGFNPAMNYSHAADKYINNFASSTGMMIDKQGNYYYVSHPPLAYYIPYLIFKTFHIYPSVPAIQMFHLAIHFLCGIGIYLVIGYLLPVAGNQLSWHAFVGYSFYMLSPATLWFQSNTYMADMFVQLFFIAGVYVALKLLAGRTGYWLLGILTFLMIYTSWLGVFFAFTMVTLCLLRYRELRGIKIITATTAGFVLAILLIIFQYSQINGWEAYFAEASGRYFTRGSAGIFNSGLCEMLRTVFIIAGNYLTGYLPLVGLIIYLVSRPENFTSLWKNESFRIFIYLSFIPVLLLHAVLMNYSGHDFTALYGALFLSVLAGALSQSLIQTYNRKKIILVISLCMFLSVGQYYYINRPGDFSYKGDRYAVQMEIGKFIKTQATFDEVIFIKGLKPTPEIVFYAHRNILQVADENEAIKFLQQTGNRKGILFEFDETGQIELEKRIVI